MFEELLYNLQTKKIYKYNPACTVPWLNVWIEYQKKALNLRKRLASIIFQMIPPNKSEEVEEDGDQILLFCQQQIKKYQTHFLPMEQGRTVRNLFCWPTLNVFASWLDEFTKQLLLRNYLLPGILGSFV